MSDKSFLTARFTPETTRVFRSLGWTVSEASGVATRLAGGVLSRVEAGGAWRVTRRRTVLGQGQESHPSLAGCDANEVHWAAVRGEPNT